MRAGKADKPNEQKETKESPKIERQKKQPPVERKGGIPRNSTK